MTDQTLSDTLSALIRETDGQGWTPPMLIQLVTYLPAILAALREREGLRAALEAMVPPPLCGESWDLPDDEWVEILTTFGKVKAARQALENGQ